MLRGSLLFLVVFPSAAFAQPATEAAPKYAEPIKALEVFINREVEDKRLSALSIALVDDQQIVWARGFGFADREGKKPATADTVYRVGSVSKLFTDIAVMQLVEKGDLDLDAPVTKYLPDFKPKNQFDKPITLRMLMAHRSGLIREPPVGSYFHDDDPPLDKMVESLNGIPLVYEPGKKIKYSNAAIATVGYALEKTQKQPFAKYVQEKVLDPLGMKRSAFGPRPDLIKNLAAATMWTYHGREFPAPTFELGMAPAGCTYSTVNDLARFMTVIFAGGKGILKPATLEQMLSEQFPEQQSKEKEKDDGPRYGIGFRIGELDKIKRIGHGGAIYGFATDLAFLPTQKLGAVVVASRDVANPVVSRIADEALRLMRAVKDNKKLPAIEISTPLKPAEALALAGRYRAKEKEFDLVERSGKLWMFPAKGGLRVEIRKLGNDLVTDDIVGTGTKFERKGDKLRFEKGDYEKVRVEKPDACPKEFLDLIGEYGWDHNTLYIFEKDGLLHCNIEWVFIYPLTPEKIGPDSPARRRDIFNFPDHGLYHGEKVVFKRDANGKVIGVEAASVYFKRRHIDGEDGVSFSITPEKPVDQLMKAALADKPPAEKGDFRAAELVDVAKLDPTILFDLRYAKGTNFLRVPLYPASARPYLQKPAAEALVKVNARLKKDGYGLLIFDAYRPWHVTKVFWDATPVKWHHFVADPSKGSRHNRGCAVDLALYDLETKSEVPMVSGFDEFSDRSYPDYLGGTSLQRWHRDHLRRAMEAEGFAVYEAEWWHFDYKDWKSYAIGNQSFQELGMK
jgi:serine beta-lactamase-like protein LACTB